MNSPQPLVSVIIPVYNAALYLGQAIESILAQQWQPLEIIVVDDGSTDDSMAIAQSFPIVNCLQQSHAGASMARNRGVAAASGEWLAFLDADDLWMADKLTKQSAVLQTQRTIDMVFGQVEQFYSAEVATQDAWIGLLGREQLAGYHVGAMLIRRTEFERVGFFDPQWQVAHFIEWYGRAQSLGLKSLVLPDLVMRRRIHTTNLGIRAHDLARREYIRLVKAKVDRHSGKALA